MVVVPIDELIIGDMVEKGRNDIQAAIQNAQKHVRLKRSECFHALAVRRTIGGRWVAITNEEGKLIKRGHGAPCDLFEVRPFNHWVVEAFLLRRGSRHLREYFIDHRLRILFRPDRNALSKVSLGVGAADVYHSDIDDVPIPQRLVPPGQLTGTRASTGNATITGDDIATPNNQQGLAE